jgi:hypothetical protein
MAKTKHDWTKLDLRIDNLKAQGWTNTQIAKAHIRGVLAV